MDTESIRNPRHMTALSVLFPVHFFLLGQTLWGICFWAAGPVFVGGHFLVRSLSVAHVMFDALALLFLILGAMSQLVFWSVGIVKAGVWTDRHNLSAL